MLGHIVFMGIMLFAGQATAAVRAPESVAEEEVVSNEADELLTELLPDLPSQPVLYPFPDTHSFNQQNAGNVEDLDLKKLWLMLTEGMAPEEKVAYAKEFLLIVQQHQTRATVREEAAAKMIVVKVLVALACIGLVAYVIYALIQANKAETERAHYKAKVDKATAAANAASATAATAASANSTAYAAVVNGLKIDVDNLKKTADDLRRSIDLLNQRAANTENKANDQEMVLQGLKDKECIDVTSLSDNLKKLDIAIKKQAQDIAVANEGIKNHAAKINNLDFRISIGEPRRAFGIF
jgi:hypothetical protein